MSDWITQTQMAQELGIDNLSIIDNWIKRKKVKFKVLKPTKKILVKRGSVTVKKYAAPT